MVYRRIRDLRNDADLSQKQLGLQLGIAQRTLSSYETGHRFIPIDVLCQLADFYGTSVDYLLGRTDEKRPYPKAKPHDTL